MSPRPKYTAAVDFSCAGTKFAAGDPVDNPIVLDAVLPFGDRFVTTNTKRARVADRPVVEMTKDELVAFVEANGLDLDTSQNKPELLTAVQATTAARNLDPTTSADADTPKEQ